MTIPDIGSYALPSSADLPTNRVRWTPDPKRAALLVHDMQEYFLRFYARDAQPILTLLANVARIAAACRAQGIPVIYTAQPPEQSLEERGLLQDMWGPGITAQPEAHVIAREIAPLPGDIVLTKYRYSAFQRTELLQLLRGRARDQLIVCGVYAHIGCLLTACDAFMNDVQPFFVVDAVADFSLHHHKLAITYAAERCAVTLDSARLLEALGQGGDALSPGALHARLAALLEVEPGSFGDDDDLFDLGLDSIRLMSLVEQLRALGAEVAFVDLAECRTTRELAARVRGEVPA